MSENFKSVLADKSELQITFLVDDGDGRIELRTDGTYDLSVSDDVIVFVNQSPMPVTVNDPTHATVPLGDWSRYADESVSLMIRIGEFFDGWELEP